jgi:multiple sugar transport system substrate-binding protein
MDSLIDEFNVTTGREQGIIISVEAITSSAELQASLNMIVNGDPGAPRMPDITTGYPAIAILFKNRDMLVNFDDYFTRDEIAKYVPAFVNEGRLGDSGLYVFPFAKSTEILYLNQTLFNRFAEATGVTMDYLKSFEGIADAAARYYQWSGGKQFYNADSWINLAQAGMLQQGTRLFENETLALDNAYYRRIWETCYAPSVTGGFAIFTGFSSDLSRTGDIICSTGSSAGILFYGTTITYPDNTVEQVEYNILPFPVFDGGRKVAIQRGNGLMVAKSDRAREYAAAQFIKWFTDPKQNMRFIAGTGYLPVTGEAFERHLPEVMETAENPHIRQMLRAVIGMYNEYDFFVPPVFGDFDRISRNYVRQYREFMTREREVYLSGGNLDHADALYRFMDLLNR